MEKIGLVLREHPFFKDLKQEHLDILAGCASLVDFKAGSVIFKEGQEVDHLHIIRDGLVAIEILHTSKPAVIETLQGNDLLGWSWLFPPYRAHFNCRVIKDARVIALDGKYLRKKCEEDHDFGYELMKKIMKIVAQRLEATRIQFLNIYGN